jgi:hypothetical protein
MSPRIEPTHRRPWFLWWFSLIITWIGLYNLSLAVDHVRHADTYRALGVSYPPLLRAGFALLWGILFVALGIGLARQKSTARRWILIILSNYGLFNVLWLMVFARSDFARSRIPFHATLTLLLIALVGWVLRWRRMRVPFERRSEPTQPESTRGEVTA